MRTTLPTLSAYLETFRCIGSDCEDTCCQGWNVPIDRITYEKCQNLPASPLATLISASLTKCESSAPSKTATGVQAKTGNATPFAQIRIDGADHCPLLTGDRLCRVHAELGEQMLSYACSTYPRIVHEFGGLKETALALSCPEAARFVLLNPCLPIPNLKAPETQSPRQSTPAPALDPFVDALEQGNAEDGAKPLPPDFIAIRESVLELVRLRSYPLWQRMFLLGLLCRRLDSIARGELKRSVPGFLADFKTAVSTGSLRPAMETLPVDRAAQLDVVLRLAGLMLHRSHVSPRFAECIQAFTAGIGNGPGATLETLTRQYTRAHEFSFEPFFERHPHVLENYLVNTIVRCQFPFGREGMEVGAEPQRAREFAKLTAQFALIRGLLIGVAGFHGASFSTAHVVAVVQPAAKHFEHHPEFLKLSFELLLESQMDGARGMAILLSNAEQKPATSVLPDIRVPSPYQNRPVARQEV
jgi:lysine-N-methylase